MSAFDVERWIRRELSAAVAAGNGRWGESSEANFGKSIYEVTDGQISLSLSQLGFTYRAPQSSISYFYDEIDTIELSSLTSLMEARGDLKKIMTIELVQIDKLQSERLELPLHIYSNVATVMARIVNELNSSDSRSIT